MGFFSKIKEAISGDSTEVLEEAEREDYVELGTDGSKGDSKITVRPFLLQDFESIKAILDVLRDGHTIALVNIKPLKEKDLVELKRAINKLKKTCDAIEGDIAGFGDDWIAAVPAFARIHRAKKEEEEPKKNFGEVAEYSSAEQSPDDDSEPKIEAY